LNHRAPLKPGKKRVAPGLVLSGTWTTEAHSNLGGAGLAWGIGDQVKCGSPPARELDRLWLETGDRL
jgi:hypothetical protein